MRTNPIKLIAMDIDGTLLDSSGNLPAENARAIADAAACGIEIMVVTGRRFLPAQRIANELACEVHVISSNGALIKSKSGETDYRRLLPVSVAREVLDATPDFRASTGIIFDRTPPAPQVVFERVDWEGPFVGPYLRRHRDQLVEIVPLTSCLDSEDPVEVLFIGECEKMRRAMRTLETHPSSPHFTLALTEYPNRNLSFLDVLGSGVTKGAALAEWASRKGITREHVMAIGDNWNDREMLAFAGLPVIMGNSVPELKSLGWKVTLSNDDCGVAAAIRTYALNGLGNG